MMRMLVETSMRFNDLGNGGYHLYGRLLPAFFNGQALPFCFICPQFGVYDVEMGRLELISVVGMTIYLLNISFLSISDAMWPRSSFSSPLNSDCIPFFLSIFLSILYGDCL